MSSIGSTPYGGGGGGGEGGGEETGHEAIDQLVVIVIAVSFFVTAELRVRGHIIGHARNNL